MVEVTDRIPHANARRELCHCGESRAGSDKGNRIKWVVVGITLAKPANVKRTAFRLSCSRPISP